MAITAVPGHARAYEDAVTVAASVGAVFADSPPVGLSLGASVGVGLNDTWELRLRGTSNIFERATEFIGAVELVYLLDILEFVPIVGIGLDGGARLQVSPLFGGHLVVGLDWLPTNLRPLIFGIELRPYLLLDSNSANIGVRFNAELRVGVVFD